MTTPVHPGSRTHAAAAAEAAAEPDQFHVAVKNEELATQIPLMQPVPVKVANPEGAVYRTTVLNASQARQLLPQDNNRKLAAVISIDEDIVLTATKELAQDSSNQVASVPYPTGFYLSKGTLMYLTSKGLVWAANTNTSTPTRVSVMVELDEDTDPFSNG